MVVGYIHEQESKRRERNIFKALKEENKLRKTNDQKRTQNLAWENNETPSRNWCIRYRMKGWKRSLN